MAQFNLQDYETVEQRLARFWADDRYQDARIVTINHTSLQDRQVSTWVVETRIYLTADDQRADLPKATGWAFEVDGGSGANRTAALENAETSSIGRCLANLGMSGNKRTSREEMAKAERGITPPPAKSGAGLTADARKKAVATIETATSKEQLRALYKSLSASLDDEFLDEAGNTVTLKSLIIARQAEIPGE
jgi:hypothetical protein